MSKLLLNKAFGEYHQFPDGELLPVESWGSLSKNILFRNKEGKECVSIKNGVLHTRHFVGVDWLVEFEHAIYVQPRLNNGHQQTNYLEMLAKTMLHPELASHMHDLYEIKFGSPYIEVHSEEDLLTPLLVGRFISLVKRIVKKGLKKSYYKTTENLHCKLKGKILQAKTLKENHMRNRTQMTFCQFEVHGIGNAENRFLKHVLNFCRQYLSSANLRGVSEILWPELQFVSPAFRDVEGALNVNEAKTICFNPFYAEYTEAIRIGSLIIQRFGYNISNVLDRPVCLVPPFWIDMSKLFELYVYNLLKEKFCKNILFQFNAATGIPDLLLPIHRILADVKYKPKYEYEDDRDDIKQVCTYAKDVMVQEHLGSDPYIVLFYPTLNKEERNWGVDAFTAKELKGYKGIYKFGVTLPVLATTPHQSIRDESALISQMV